MQTLSEYFFTHQNQFAKCLEHATFIGNIRLIDNCPGPPSALNKALPLRLGNLKPGATELGCGT